MCESWIPNTVNFSKIYSPGYFTRSKTKTKKHEKQKEESKGNLMLCQLNWGKTAQRQKQNHTKLVWLSYTSVAKNGELACYSFYCRWMTLWRQQHRQNLSREAAVQMRARLRPRLCLCLCVCVHVCTEGAGVFKSLSKEVRRVTEVEVCWEEGRVLRVVWGRRGV